MPLPRLAIAYSEPHLSEQPSQKLLVDCRDDDRSAEADGEIKPLADLLKRHQQHHGDPLHDIDLKHMLAKPVVL